MSLNGDVAKEAVSRPTFVYFSCIQLCWNLQWESRKNESLKFGFYVNWQSNGVTVEGCYSWSEWFGSKLYRHWICVVWRIGQQQNRTRIKCRSDFFFLILSYLHRNRRYRFQAKLVLSIFRPFDVFMHSQFYFQLENGCMATNTESFSTRIQIVDSECSSPQYSVQIPHHKRWNKFLVKWHRITSGYHEASISIYCTFTVQCAYLSILLLLLLIFCRVQTHHTLPLTRTEYSSVRLTMNNIHTCVYCLSAWNMFSFDCLYWKR